MKRCAPLGLLLLSLSPLPARSQALSAAPTYGVHRLSGSFEPDPLRIELLAGGPNLVRVEGEGRCTGFINNAAPDVELVYQPGTWPLSVYVHAEADTTLVIHGPSGWHCADDTSGRNPGITFPRPEAGRYDIWVGHYDGASTPPAELFISELGLRW